MSLENLTCELTQCVEDRPLFEFYFFQYKCILAMTMKYLTWITLYAFKDPWDYNTLCKRVLPFIMWWCLFNPCKYHWPVHKEAYLSIFWWWFGEYWWRGNPYYLWKFQHQHASIIAQVFLWKREELKKANWSFFPYSLIFQIRKTRLLNICDRQTEQWNRSENQKIDSDNYNQLIFIRRTLDEKQLL